jgi:hypothetical protein
MEQVIEPLERAMELTPILGELGYNESHSFNGLLQVSAAGGPSCGESQKVRGLWYCVAIWVKDGPGYGKLIADWMTDGRTEIDHNSIDYSRFYPHQMTEEFIEDRCYEAAQKIYFPAIHPREPYASSRGVKQSPFYEREVELGGHFMELGGWERAHGYAPTSTCWRNTATGYRFAKTSGTTGISGASPMPSIWQLSEDCGIINLSHFHMVDVEGPGPCRDDGMAVRGQDRRRQQYRQGHLHPLPR